MVENKKVNRSKAAVSFGARYSFRRGNFFPPQVYYTGVLGIAGAVFLFWKGHHDFSVLILFIVSVLLIFTHKGTMVHLQKQYIRNYVNFGGLLLGENIPFQGITDIYIEKKRVSQRMYSRASSSTIRYDMYQAFLVADQQTYLLTEGKRKAMLLAKLKGLSLAISLPVRDLT